MKLYNYSNYSDKDLEIRSRLIKKFGSDEYQEKENSVRARLSYDLNEAHRNLEFAKRERQYIEENGGDYSSWDYDNSFQDLENRYEWCKYNYDHPWENIRNEQRARFIAGKGGSFLGLLGNISGTYDIPKEATDAINSTGEFLFDNREWLRVAYEVKKEEFANNPFVKKAREQNTNIMLMKMGINPYEPVSDIENISDVMSDVDEQGIDILDKIAEFIIKDASVTEEVEKAEELLHKDRLKYRANLSVVLKVTDKSNLSSAETTINAWRELRIPVDTNIAEKEKYWNEMVQKLFEEFNVRMEQNINQYLNMYVKNNNTVYEY